MNRRRLSFPPRLTHSAKDHCRVNSMESIERADAERADAWTQRQRINEGSGTRRADTIDLISWRFVGNGKYLDDNNENSDKLKWEDSIDCIIKLPGYSLEVEWNIELISLDIMKRIEENRWYANEQTTSTGFVIDHDVSVTAISGDYSDGVSSFDCFISYIVHSDLKIAEQIYKILVKNVSKTDPIITYTYVI